LAPRSLRLRLLAAALVAIVLALSVSGYVLARLFERHVEAREFAELRNHQNQIIAAIEIGTDGIPALSALPADPRFIAPNGGLYWQIELPDGSKQRSRSLWETELKLPIDELVDGSVHRHEIAGPDRSILLAIERGITVGPDRSPLQLRLTVAVDRRDIDVANVGFRGVLMASLGVLGLALLGALLFQVEVGLRPLARLRTALQLIHSGGAERVSGTFPREVQPLIEDVNALLDRERLNNAHSRERAADLAHGFKTPLAVLGAIARDLHRDGRTVSASDVETQIDMMSGHVQRELARARTVGGSVLNRAPVIIRPIIAKIVGALTRISADRHLTWTVEVADDVQFIGDENDLLELIGNLADNGAKWATSQVWVTAHNHNQQLTISVEDNGPGIPEGAEADVLVRGRRLDETTDGSGLGLAIVAKIIEAYGGTIIVSRASAGGLSVVVVLPG
jgi:signal transduction histidine kinase